MRTQPGLDSKLNAYEKTSGEDRLARKGRRRNNWRVYAAAAGSGLAMTTSAEANIIYSGPLDVTATAGLNQGKAKWTTSIDGGKLVGNAVLESFVSSFTNFRRGEVGLNIQGGVSVLLSNSHQARHLSSGKKISQGAGHFGGANYGSVALRFTNNHYPGGSWAAKSQPGFAGIRVGSHYGWVELKWGATAGGGPNSITLLGWAYDTVGGQAITAGEGIPSAVPEPSTGLLALLATGCLGVAAWRKRKLKPLSQQAVTA